MAFWSRQRTCGDDKVFAVGTNARKMANGRNWGILVRSRESKMEIPAKMVLDFSEAAKWE